MAASTLDIRQAAAIRGRAAVFEKPSGRTVFGPHVLGTCGPAFRCSINLQGSFRCQVFMFCSHAVRSAIPR